MGSDHIPIEISIDAPSRRNSSASHTKNNFDHTEREVFGSTLKTAISLKGFSGLTSTSDLYKHADLIVSAISTAVDKAIPKSRSVHSKSNPINNETLALINEKRRLRRQYSQIKGTAVKTRINQLQKQVKEDLRVETQACWEKLCNSVSLESDPNESWCKFKNFLKPEGQHDHPTLHHDDKVAKTNADKAQLFAKSVERHFGIEGKHFDSNHFNEVNKFIEDNHSLEPEGQHDHPTLHHDDKVAKTNADKAQLFAQSVERHFGIESKHFDSNHFNEVNKFIEDNHRYCYPTEDRDDYRFGLGNEHELVEDVNPHSLIKFST